MLGTISDSQIRESLGFLRREGGGREGRDYAYQSPVILPVIARNLPRDGLFAGGAALRGAANGTKQFRPKTSTDSRLVWRR